MVHQICVWIKDFFDQLGEWLITLWAATYAAFYYVFQPTAAWNAAWSMFVLSFITKMIQMSYEEKSFWRMLRTRFSARIAVQKATPRVIFYLVLMFAVARGRDVFPNTITSNLHFVATSFVFAIELLNSLQHINQIPGVDAGCIINWVKKTLMPRGIERND